MRANPPPQLCSVSKLFFDLLLVVKSLGVYGVDAPVRLDSIMCVRTPAARPLSSRNMP